MFTTAVALVCLFFKHYAAQIWSDYPNPVKFYKQIIREQYLSNAEINKNSGSFRIENLTQSYLNTENKVVKVLTDYRFYAEVLILLLMPYHHGNRFGGFFRI